MTEQTGPQHRVWDPLLIASLLIPGVLLPLPAYAIEVGCFFTAVFLGMMFLVAMGLAMGTKHALARYVWKAPRTPWLRMFGLTWIELLLGIVIFALARTSYWLTVLLYLPIALLMNRALLSKFSPPTAGADSFLKRNSIFLLLPLSLPVSLQVAGMLWKNITDLITFTEIR
jgi:hypothetical protein